MNAMILAAGPGTRLGPYTQKTPKTMLLIGGRPVLAYIVLWLRHYGIRKIAINLHYLSQDIQTFLEDGKKFGVDACYSYEEQLLGTAGAVKRLESFFEDPFIVVYGDVLTDINLTHLVDFHQRYKQKGCHCTLAVDQRPHARQCGVVEMDNQGRLLRFAEKPDTFDGLSPWVNSGVMVLDRDLLTDIPAGQTCDFGRDILPAWLERGLPVFAWKMPAENYLIDMGTQENYAKANQDWPTDRFRIILEEGNTEKVRP